MQISYVALFCLFKSIALDGRGQRERGERGSKGYRRQNGRNCGDVSVRAPLVIVLPPIVLILFFVFTVIITIFVITEKI
jgi:hypothetical protein